MKERDYSANSATGCGSEGQRTCKFIDEENISLGVENVTAGPATSDTISFFTAGDGPAVSGIYYEDYYYDAQCTAQGDEYLDEHSGHDHDGLGYHYHTSVDEALSPVFPLVNAQITTVAWIAVHSSALEESFNENNPHYRATHPVLWV